MLCWLPKFNGQSAQEVIEIDLGIHGNQADPISPNDALNFSSIEYHLHYVFKKIFENSFRVYTEKKDIGGCSLVLLISLTIA